MFERKYMWYIIYKILYYFIYFDIIRQNNGNIYSALKMHGNNEIITDTNATYGYILFTGVEFKLKRVLIVDDAIFMRKSLSLILKKTGFEIVGEADNGINGVLKYAELKPDLVTMDITMPFMDGITALKEIKKIDTNAKVIMVSAMGQEAYVREAIVAGAKSFIVKPFKENHVIKVLESISSQN